MKKDFPFVSVIVPTFNNRTQLERCLCALQEQTYPSLCFEVIIIDNDSYSSPEAMVKKYGARFARERRPGSYASRNRGISLARGEIIAFTDSDCIPAADWIEKGVQRLQSDESVGLVGGYVRVIARNKGRLSAIELYDSLDHFDQERFILHKKFSVTANTFTWMRVLVTVGQFDDRFKSFGDIEWGNRVYRRGYSLLYAKDVIVEHPAKANYKELWQRSRRLAGGNRRMRHHLGTNWVREFFVLIRYWIELPAFIAVSAFRPKLKGIRQRLLFLGISVFIHCAKGIEELRLISHPDSEVR